MILSFFSKSILSSEGIFEIHIKKYILYQSLDLRICCPKTDRFAINCASKCKIFMEICLSIYQKVPHRYECDIGENMIVTDILGNQNSSEVGNKDYSIKVRERWNKNFNILVKIRHRDEKTKKLESIVTLSSAEENVKPSSHWITKQLSTPKDNFELHVSFRYSCSKHHFGDKCDKYCKPSQSGTGHYNCTGSGDIVCHHGYTGTYCDKVVCQNKCIHGTCIGPNLCRCSTGWSGGSCEKCIPYPGCVNGACRLFTKNNDLLPLTCDCKKGWGGMFCNIDLNFCSNNPNVCLNGGECQNFGNINTNQQYRCICKPGFTGTHCEKSVSNCVVRGCQNDGFCQVNTSKCICKQTFYGDQCQFNMTSCAESPCVGSNSKCISNSKLGFICDCATGFMGRNCEIDKDECSTNPCQNGGMCIDRASGFRCVCPVGFHGNRCQVNKNDCQRLSCMNGAKCMDRANRIDCECTTGWTGGMCNQNINECASNQPCVNGGICEDTLGSYRCICPHSWGGIHCQNKIFLNETENKIKRCRINPCENDGICYLASAGRDYTTKDMFETIGGPYYCVCKPGFTGALCKRVITANRSSVDSSFDSVSFTDKGNRNHVTFINLIIISVGVPAIFIILTFISVLCCKYSKRLRHGEMNSKCHNNFKNNENIKFVNNKLNHGQKIGANNDKILLSEKNLKNGLHHNDLNNYPNNMIPPFVPLHTYTCSRISLVDSHLSGLDCKSNVNSNLFSLKSMDIDEEEDEFMKKSLPLLTDRNAEPESVYQNSSPKKEIKKISFKSSLDSVIDGPVERDRRMLIGCNSAVLKRRRGDYVGYGLCSSQNSLLESPNDQNLRAAISQQVYQSSMHIPYEENLYERNIQVNGCTLNQNHNQDLNVTRPLTSCNIQSHINANTNSQKQSPDNRYVLYYPRSILPHRINYNLVSNPKFKETSCFLESNVTCPSLKSVKTNSTSVDDNSSLNL